MDAVNVTAVPAGAGLADESTAIVTGDRTTPAGERPGAHAASVLPP